jgi:hypothetical protein
MRLPSGLHPASHRIAFDATGTFNCCRRATREQSMHSRSSSATNNVRAEVVERGFADLFVTG